MMAARGHELILLETVAGASFEGTGTPHREWLGVSQAEDAHQTIAALNGERCDWLIVDHYALDEDWESILRASATRILAIDDLADRQHDCDVLLDQNLYLNAESRYDGKVPQACRLLLGPRYALLREEFARARAVLKARSGAVHRILVFYGGVDATNRTEFAIEALIIATIHGACVDVVIGKDHPRRKQIEAACGAAAYALHIQTSRMAELMSAADLGVGAGGSATWERCCVGLPTLANSVAGNQDNLVHDCALSGALYALDLDGARPEDLALHVRALVANPLLRESISRKGMEIVDGHGVRRVLRSMGIGQVAVRRATLADSRNLFQWRDHPVVREVSRCSEPLEWDAHRRWLESILLDPSRELLIGVKAGRPIGVVRFDILDDTAEVSIYLVVEPMPFDEGQVGAGIAEARGAGADLLAAAEAWLALNRPTARCLVAEVIRENQPSHRLFRSAGYVPRSVTYTKRVK